MTKAHFKKVFKLCMVSFLLTFYSSNTFALEKVDTKTILYKGQVFENVQLQKSIKETRYREEQRQSTCTREVAYTENVCRDEVRYKRECHMTPGGRECRTEYENICHYETRYRNRCHYGPGRRVCRQRPGRRVCRRVPGQERCRVNRRGQRVCKRTPGREVCRNRPGRQICEQRPGRRICRQESYQERICRSVPRNRCYNTPPRQVCHQVPYTQNVCRDVTKYRTETYACTKPVKVPYEVTRTLRANLNLNFVSLSEESAQGINFQVTLLANGKILTQMQNKDQSRAFVFLTKNLNRVDQDLISDITGELDFKIEDKSKYLAPFKNNIYDVVLRKRSLEFSIVDPKDIRDLEFKLTIERKGKIIFNNILPQSSLEWHNLDDKFLAVVDFRKLDFKVKKKKEYNLTLKMTLKGLGSHLLNPLTIPASKSSAIKIQAIK